ncbi:hypothetical protein OAV88_00940 [bacterium]|nr:hypothetical protein [bacterium]
MGLPIPFLRICSLYLSISSIQTGPTTLQGSWYVEAVCTPK